MGVAPYRKRESKNINDEAFTAINLALNTHYWYKDTKTARIPQTQNT
jgi:hypothetical protein